MNIREAILAAAQHIKANPDALNFCNGVIPKKHGGERACPLAWAMYFGGAQRGELASAHYPQGLMTFFVGMDSCQPWWAVFSDTWHTSPRVCAATLRRYADKYHPQPRSDTKSQRHTTPPTTTAPKYDFEGLAQRLAKEPRAAAVGEPGAA